MHDIYGEESIDQDIVAVGLGKVAMAASTADFRREDIARSLVNMIAYNIGQIAFLNAKLHSMTRILFGGNFIRG
mgnify:CR=1 FL=1